MLYPADGSLAYVRADMDIVILSHFVHIMVNSVSDFLSSHYGLTFVIIIITAVYT